MMEIQGLWTPNYTRNRIQLAIGRASLLGQVNENLKELLMVHVCRA